MLGGSPSGRTANLPGDRCNDQKPCRVFFALIVNRLARRMRIALVTDGLFPMSVGGMQAHSTNLARSLAAEGVNVVLVYPQQSDVSPNRVLAQLDIPAASARLIPAPWPSMPPFPGHYVAELWSYSARVKERLEKEKDIDWIYVQGLCGMALMTGRRSEMPPIAVNLHGLEMFQLAPTLRESAQQLFLRPPARFSARKADLCVSLGGGTTRMLRSIGVPADRIAEIPVGIDGAWALHLPRPVRRLRRLLFVGRYERRKGIEPLSDVVARLHGKTEFEFDFVGPIPLEHQIVGKGIRYWGMVSDRQQLGQIMDDCEIVVCPSYAEGMPTVILEGMARGLAVIATNVGAVDELVDDRNGWLIKPLDTTALENAIRQSLSVSDDQLYARKKASLERFGTRFRWDQAAKSTVNALNSWKGAK